MDEQGILAVFAQWQDAHRLGHAYLLHHEDPVYVSHVANQIVQSTLCSMRLEAGGGCGQCPSCRQALSGNHSGIIWLEPDGASLKIAQMRSALRLDRHKTSREGLHIIVLADAHRLTIEAANAILKWVEEPAEGRLFLLLTPSVAGVLPTLRSRSVALHLQHAAGDELVAIEKLLSSLGTERFAEAQKLVVELTQAIADKRPEGWQLIASPLAKLRLSAEETLQFVDAWLSLMRDVAMVGLGSKPSAKWVDRATLARIAERTTPMWLAEAALQLAAQRRHLLSHVSPLVTLEAYLIRMLSPAGGESPWPSL